MYVLLLHIPGAFQQSRLWKAEFVRLTDLYEYMINRKERVRVAQLG